ncbi:MAG: zinc-binding dehydrogenase [Rhodobacteraceae bacterium]|nr:zinc-binding dehydrogenase [Paracoccaceae bacterium]MCF8516415.1 zinc-binding dehydrogenase [Paracoccaceae bacterium]MCF8520765.1 zinc-binding dehydrogenase [Paracoccaceae bacterium]
MRAVIFDAPDGRPDSTVIRDVADPVAGPGQALVRISHAGLNYADLMMRQGIYPHPKGYPLIAGLELAGTVVDVGPGVTAVAPGDRVAAFSEDAGAFAELCAVPVERIIHLPDRIGLDTAAASYVQALTAWNLLHNVSATKPGDVVLIHAIGGGVGLFLTQLAKAAGATVIGTVGTAGKEARALDYGADLVINRAETDFVAATLAFSGGRGVDKVVDSTGASILDRSFDTIRKLGHVVSYGEAEGKPFANLWERLVQKSLTFTRMHLGHLDYGSDIWRRGVAEVMSGIENGTIQVPIEGVFTFETVEDMFAALASRQTAGKLILKIGA